MLLNAKLVPQLSMGQVVYSGFIRAFRLQAAAHCVRLEEWDSTKTLQVAKEKTKNYAEKDPKLLSTAEKNMYGSII